MMDDSWDAWQKDIKGNVFRIPMDIRAAKKGNRLAAKRLIRAMAHYLEVGELPPNELAMYFIEAFKNILDVKSPNANKALNLSLSGQGNKPKENMERYLAPYIKYVRLIQSGINEDDAMTILEEDYGIPTETLTKVLPYKGKQNKGEVIVAFLGNFPPLSNQ